MEEKIGENGYYNSNQWGDEREENRLNLAKIHPEATVNTGLEKGDWNDRRLWRGGNANLRHDMKPKKKKKK